MEGYYIEESKESPEGTNSGTLHIYIANVQDFKNLIEQAEEEARRLEKTISELSRFRLEIDFSTCKTTSLE